jgi:tRNA pseudouridine55 synthase
MINGWLNVYKPLNVSSASIVARVKKILGKNIKVGHCGTLDPLASGILPIAIGQATKLSNYLVGSKKTYVFTIKFGASTATGDAEGDVLRTCEFVPNSAKDLENIIPKFLGKIQQKTPKYAASKINGKPFYKLARQGLDVPERIRDIEIFSLKLLSHDMENATATYEASCSKGTYIRELAQDIAISLKSLGFVIQLTRISVKNFSVANSLSLSGLSLSGSSGDRLLELSNEMAVDEIKNSLLPVEYILDDIPVIDLDINEATKVGHGKTLLIFQDDLNLLWLRFQKRLVSIGRLSSNRYNIFCNFNLGERNDVDCTRA